MNEEHVTQELEVVALDLTFNPEVFDPNKDTLRAIAKEVALIEADPEKMDKDTLELINVTKNKLVKARTRIQKIGKAQREPANAYAKEVSAYEKELLAILAPEEERMKVLESTAKEHAMKVERLKTLPEYIEKLNGIGDAGLFAPESAITEDFLLTLDPNQRDQFYNERLAAKNEADRAAIAEEKRQAEEEKAIALQSLITARREIMFEVGFVRSDNGITLYTIDNGQINATDEQIYAMSESDFAKQSDLWRKSVEAKKAADIKATQEQATKEAQEKAQKEAAAEESKRQAEQEAEKKRQEEAAEAKRKEEEARQTNEKYQQWLNDHQYNPETDRLSEAGDQIELFRFVGSYKK